MGWRFSFLTNNALVKRADCPGVWYSVAVLIEGVSLPLGSGVLLQPLSISRYIVSRLKNGALQLMTYRMN